MIQQIIDGMKLENGYIHLEAFINKKGSPTICEFGWRMAGCKIPEDHGYAYGFDVHDTLLDICIGKNVILDYSKNKKCVGDLYLPNKEGLVTNITPAEELLKMEGAFKAELFTQKGEYQASRRRGTDASGYVHVDGKTIEEVEKRMHYILDKFKIETQEKEK